MKGVSKKIRFVPRQTSLQTKVVLMFLILLLFVVCCFLAYVNWQVIRPLKENNEKEKQLTAAKISGQLDQYIKNQNQLSQRVLSNEQVTAALSGGYHSGDSAEGLTQSRILKRMMFEAIGPSVDIRDMIIYDLEGRALSSYIGYPTNPVKIEPELKSEMDNNDYILYQQPNGITAFDRAIINQNGQIFGYLSIQLDQSELQLPTEDVAVGDVYIMDQEHQFIARSQNADKPSDLELLEADPVTSGMYLDDRSNYVAYNQSASTGWTTYVVTPKHAVLGPVNSVQYLSIAFISILMLFSFVYIYFSTRNLLLPIRKLRGQISRINYSNLDVKVDNRSHNNELIALSDSFQELLGRLQQSIENEKLALQEEMKARNSALQSQIAPHFIHNVLYLISIAAQEGKNNAVSDMCKHLSDSLRYIVTSPYQHVSLTEELEHIRNYLSLVQQNYENDLEWEIIADDAAANLIQLPRLVIQPFVENCIEHAFTNTDPPWRIKILVKLYNGIWAIEISDNGEGIEAGKINEIMNNISNSEAREHELHMPTSFGNMGIVNTVNRLKLMYKNRLFFNLYNNSGEDKGSTVQIIASLTKDFY
ncbi:sensor histidine kinase [Paenibacillus lupini]|uniref:sensor histidine kinase n=1 Tax=Paenibacillus lupini TaxID=1450204 RepID=UPI001ABA48D1|nr:sensor histidine kinase [Paenibacillus lupini]NIK22544.1 two-component system sensor histidine kinase YesM [Paenibacillus lupini]